MPQYLFDHLGLVALDKRDDLHLAVTLGTDQRVDLIHLFDHRAQRFRASLTLGAATEFRAAGDAAFPCFLVLNPRLLFE